MTLFARENCDLTRMTERTIKVGVLCIQGSFIEHISMLQRLADTRSDGITLSVVDVRRSSQVADLDGLIIPGGESTTLSVFLRNNNFEEALKLWMFDEKRRGVVWGTCAGLILLSDDLAGQKQGGQVNLGGIDIQCSRNMYGRQISSFECQLTLQDPALWKQSASTGSSGLQKENECHGVFIRAPGVAKVNSPNVKILATLPDADNVVVAVQQDNLMATSFHPELTDDLRWHSYFVDMVIKNKYPEKKSLVDV